MPVTLGVKRPTPPEQEEEMGGDMKRRRIDFSVLKRKRIPTHTLIATEQDDPMIVAMGIPTKKGRYAKYAINPEGVASMVETVTEHAFNGQYPNVVRMTKPATLSMDGTIDPMRLSSNVVVVRESSKEETIPEKEVASEKETTPKEKELGPEEQQSMPEENQAMTEKDENMEKEDMEKEIKKTGLDVQQAEKEERVTEGVPTTNKKISEEEEEVIATLSHETASSELVKESVPDIRFDESELMKGYMESLKQAMDKETNLDIKRTQLAELLTMAKTLKAIEESDMPKPLKRVEKEDAETEEVENKAILSSTIHAQEQVKAAVESAEADLSMGQAVDAPVSDIATGGTNDMDIVHQLDKETTDASKESVIQAKDRRDIPLVTENDTEMHDANTDSKITLGADANADQLEKPSSHTSTVSSSANAMHAAISPMEVETDEATLKAIEDAKIAAKFDAKDAKKAEREANKMDVSPTEEEKMEPFNELTRKTQASREKFLAENRAKTLSLLETGGDIEGFEAMMQRLAGQQVIDDPEDLKVRRRVLAILRHDNKLINIKTAKVPTAEDLFREAVTGEATGLGSGKLGGTGLGTPIFVPGMARDQLYRLQQGIATLTETEATQLREELTPLWNEFKLGRLAAGVREMERMPTRLLTSDTSTIRAASKIRADVDQQEESFFYFMYWLLHDRLDSTKARTWRNFLLYSASMGYGDLTQAQINWIITGNPNGDLTATTVFSEVSEEEGDPLDRELDIRGMKLTRETIQSLSSQVIGNPEPQAQYPSRNTSPSAAPVDNSIHPDQSTGPDRLNRSELRGIPSTVSNIPDPRFSRRGGVDVPNVRIATIKNPKYDPKKKEGDPGYEKEYITQEVPDIGAGSKDIGAQIEMAESDRLLRSIPTRLYAPIHAQACDRYLGALNYQRLTLPLEQYMKTYSQHPWGPEDYQQMYNWNSFTMGLYGEMLYAFVTDIQMQRTSPVFTMDTPEAVADEYMELNELISELARFQQHADDRADRVNDSGAGQRPLEEHLNKFFENQSELDKQNLYRGDTAIISTGGLTPPPIQPDNPVNPPTPPTPPSPPTPPTPPAPKNPWGPGPDPRYNTDEPWSEKNDRRPNHSLPLSKDNDHLHIGPVPPVPDSTPPLKNPLHVGSKVMDYGIRRSDPTSIYGAKQGMDEEMERKNRIFKMFMGR